MAGREPKPFDADAKRRCDAAKQRNKEDDERKARERVERGARMGNHRRLVLDAYVKRYLDNSMRFRAGDPDTVSPCDFEKLRLD